MENRKIKILAIGDIHGDTGLVKRLVEKAERENVDWIVMSGDITFFERSSENLVGPFLDGNRRVFLIPGNHESSSLVEFLSRAYPNTRNLHGCGFVEGRVGIFGAGTANVGPYQIGDGNILKMLMKGHELIKGSEKKIMVTHMPHLGGKAEVFGFPGSKAVRDAVESFEPDVLISSHIHEAGGIEEKIGKTRVFNVSRKERVFEI